MYELSQWNAIIACLWVCVLNSKATLLFASQNDLLYNCNRSYDSFVAFVTHFLEVDLQSSSGLSKGVEITLCWSQHAGAKIQAGTALVVLTDFLL